MVNCLVMYDMVELIINYFNSLILNIVDAICSIYVSVCWSVRPSICLVGCNFNFDYKI